MNRILSFFVVFLTLLSCRSDDFGSGEHTLQPVKFTVSAKYDASLNSTIGKNVTVLLTNSNTGDTYTQNTNDSGEAVFANVIPGNYKVTATKTMDKNEFSANFGFEPNTTEVSFNGIQENVTVNANISSAAVELKAARIGDLVIKQIHYAGSHITQGAGLRDQFIEIYNNSNEVIFADGLYIAQLHGKTNSTVSSFTQANGQFDWSKSLGMTLGNAANTNFVYADYVIQIPGNGSQYPIQPGESIVIAQTGVNHKAPFTDNGGNPVNVQNPDLTIDLSGADFEVYLGTFRESIGEDIYRYDIQNPAVKDMNIAYWGIPGYYSNNKDLIFDTLGRDSFAIFRSNNFATYPTFTDPSVTSVTSSSSYFKQIPVADIIDGVELQHYNPSSNRPKILGSDIDAGSINTDAAYISQSVMRKTKTTMSNGRKVLEDTNNSSNDFVKFTKALPKAFAP